MKISKSNLVLALLNYMLVTLVLEIVNKTKRLIEDSIGNTGIDNDIKSFWNGEIQ